MVRISNTTRTHTIALCGLAIALLTASAWITIPLGPVPFTLQTCMLVFIVLTLPAKQSLISVFGYLALGALGAPVFAGFKGGLGSILGPTGGFLLGFGIGTCLALLVLKAFEHRTQTPRFIPLILAATVLVCTSYVCGWIQLMIVADLSPVAAFLSGIAPFIVLDIIKSAVAIKLSSTLLRALPSLNRGVTSK